MPDFILSAHQGLNNAQDDLRMPEGFFRIIKGAYLRPDDPDRLWKAPGRTLAGTFLSATSVSGMDFLQQDAGDRFALWANQKVYTAPAALTGVTVWSEAVDRSDPTPLAFPQVGTSPKALHDGTGRWILWSGDTEERPLLCETDGTFRRLGINKPMAITEGVSVDTPGIPIYPVAVAAVGSYDTWHDPANSYDDDIQTAATETYEYPPASQGVSGEWSFTEAGNVPAGAVVLVTLASSSLPPVGVDTPVGGGGGGIGGLDPIEARLKIDVSVDGGTVWTQVFLQYIPVLKQEVTIGIPEGGLWTDLLVRVAGEYLSGQGQVTFNVYEIYATAGKEEAVLSGNYYYAVTEVYTDPVGTEIESAPSDVYLFAVAPQDPVADPDVSDPPIYGVILTLPASRNLVTDGYDQTRLKRNIYRSTRTGVWPDLGFIASVPITDTTFIDFFTRSEDTLGSPVLPSIGIIGDLAVSLAEPWPSIRDAALYRGAVVAVLAETNASLVWSFPGKADWLPLYTQYISALPSERNDTLKAICTISDYLLLFYRTRVLRIKDLPMVSDQTFDIRISDQDILSPAEGLAGGIRSYCTFNAESGRSLVAWVSDSGIWMTDGSLNFERGLGCVKLSGSLDWSGTVDTTRLEETALTFDPVEQIMWLLYYDPNGDRRALAFHLAKLHWSGETPKVTGPHEYPLRGHLVGEFNTALRLWGWEAAYNSELSIYNVRLFNERTGTTDEAYWYDPAGQIETYLESGWYYPQGPYGEWQIYKGALFHNNWGAGNEATVRMEFRQDARGIVQNLQKGVSLLGSRISSFWLSRSGRSLRVTLRHLGHAEGALGPFVFEGETLGPAEGA